MSLIEERMIETNYSFVICKGCASALDVDYEDNKLDYVRVIVRAHHRFEPNYIRFEAKCPLCHSKNEYNSETDVFWKDKTTDKGFAMYIATRSVLKHALFESYQRENKLRRSKLKLRKDCQKLADMVHEANVRAGKMTRDADVDGEVENDTPSTASTSTMPKRPDRVPYIL